MLRLNFRTGKGDAPKLILAQFLRFCADGTLRGPDNFVVARRAESGWLVAGVLHRELECEGPLRLRLLNDVRVGPVSLGPFNLLRAAGGEFYGDESRLHIQIPGLQRPGEPLELTLLSEGATNGQAKLPSREAPERSGPQGASAGKTAAPTDAGRATQRHARRP